MRRRAALGAGVAASVAATMVATLATFRKRKRNARPTSAATARPVPTTSRAGRSVELGRVASRVGRSYATTSARQVFASAARREQLKSEHQLKTAAEVVEALGSMKGALMKLGQMASYLDAGLPEPTRQALTSLQQNAPPMSPELAASVVEEELGGAPTEVFGEWDPEPIAAASIGQVHRAITRDGLAVAVKVQYPGVDQAIRADLDNTSLLMQVIPMAFPGLDTAQLIGELRARLTEELDYRLEAANQQRFADTFAGHPFIHIPSVRADLSTARVLTSELVTGARYDEVVNWSQEERNQAGEAIFRFVFGCLYRLHAFNGDPHPGNYVFHGNGQVTFLDFGLVKWFQPGDVQRLAEMIKTLILRNDVHGFRRAVEAAGFLRAAPDLSDEEVADYFRHYYESVLTEGTVTLSPEYASETIRRFFDVSNEVVKHANVPAPFVILQRINLGLYAVLAGLRATANWRRIAEEIWPFVDAPASTPMGWSDARWRQARNDAEVAQ